MMTHQRMNLLYTRKFFQINISRSKLTHIPKRDFSDQTLHRIGQRFFVKMALHDIYALLVRVEIHRNMTK